VHAEVESADRLRFADGSPVRAASAVSRLGDGWLVAQDDAVHGAWWRPGGVQGHEVFASSTGTKHLKPDLEAACLVPHRGGQAVLLLGSGSGRGRTTAVLVRDGPGGPHVVSADLAPLYDAVARELGVPRDVLNLEGACLLDGVLRWFHRGSTAAEAPSSSADLDLAALLAAVTGGGPLGQVVPRSPRRYDLGEVDGVGLAVTDAVALPDGRVLVSAAAEDTPNPVDDGPVVGTALALLDGDDVLGVAPLPEVGDEPHKVEGIALVHPTPSGPLRLLAVVDDDDETAASTALRLRVALD
jgi:SAM-dependent methyltransferase